MNQPDTFNWKVYRPSPALIPYIESYRVIHTQGEGAQQVSGWLFASNALQLVFKLEAAHTVYGVSQDSSSGASCFVVGPLEKPAVGMAEGAISAIHVVFRPGMAGTFLRYPIDELANAAIAIDDLDNKSSLEIDPLLYECPNDNARIAVLERQLLRCMLEGEDTNPIVQQAMWQIGQAQGTLPIRALLSDLGVSERRLQRLFKQYCGVSPKTFSQLTRFWFTLQLLEREASWAEIVMHAGYHDQSHFIREFKTFTTMTPSAYTLYPQQLRLTDADANIVNDDHNGGGKDPLSLIHLVR